MFQQKSHRETFGNEINRTLNARRILSLKSKACLPIPVPLRPNTRVFEPGQYSRLINPFTKQDTFGFVPAIEGLPQDQPCVAPVILPFGRQSDSLSGFGARHILTRHRGLLSTQEATDERGVALFIANVLRNGASLFWQGGYEDSFRICAFRPGIALVVLEYRRKHDKVFWNVITAFRAQECEGDFVGSLIPASVHLAA